MHALPYKGQRGRPCPATPLRAPGAGQGWRWGPTPSQCPPLHPGLPVSGARARRGGAELRPGALSQARREASHRRACRGRQTTGTPAGRAAGPALASAPGSLRTESRKNHESAVSAPKITAQGKKGEAKPGMSLQGEGAGGSWEPHGPIPGAGGATWGVLNPRPSALWYGPNPRRVQLEGSWTLPAAGNRGGLDSGAPLYPHKDSQP